MNPAEIIAGIHARGITTRVSGDKLILSPRSKVTRELASLVRQHKAEIIEALLHPECPLLLAGIACRVKPADPCPRNPAQCNVAQGIKQFIE